MTVTGFRHVLVPVDFSDPSRTAARRAVELVDPVEGMITMLHVIEVPVAYAGEPKAPGFMDDLDRESARDLDEWATRLALVAAVPVHTRTRIGSPADQILEIVDSDPSIDLIVIGSHGRTGVRRALLGSVAEKVVRHAPCAVHVVRAGGRS